MIVVVGLPAAAVTSGLTSYESRMHAARTESATRHPVDALLVADARLGLPSSDGTTPAQVIAPVRYSGHDGTPRTGVAQVKPGTKAGTTVRLWLDGRDEVTTAPTTPGQAVVSGWTTGVTAAGGVAVTALLAWRALTHLLDRRAYAQWDAEWEQVEPGWSRRLRE